MTLFSRFHRHFRTAFSNMVWMSCDEGKECIDSADILKSRPELRGVLAVFASPEMPSLGLPVPTVKRSL